MPRLIWVFAGRKGHFVGFVMSPFILLCLTCVNNTDFCYFEAFFFSWNSPRKRGFLCIHAHVCLSPFIMSHCRRVVISFSFTTVDASHCSYSLLVGPRGDVRGVSLMVNSYVDIYKDNRRKHSRTHTVSNRRSIITMGLKLFRISMLSTEPALSTVAVKLKITAFKPSIYGKCYIGIGLCVDWYDSYTWLSTVCPANTCKDFMSTQAGLSLSLWIYLSFCRFCCAPAHLLLRCTTLVVHKFYQAWIMHKARKIMLILNQIAVLTHPYILYS